MTVIVIISSQIQVNDGKNQQVWMFQMFFFFRLKEICLSKTYSSPFGVCLGAIFVQERVVESTKDAYCDEARPKRGN